MVFRFRLTWHSQFGGLSPPSSAKYVEALKIKSTTRGIPTRSGPWLAAPFPFGIVSLVGDMGPVSQFMCVCVEI